jgi:hypothetical protein
VTEHKNPTITQLAEECNVPEATVRALVDQLLTLDDSADVFADDDATTLTSDAAAVIRRQIEEG